MNKYEQDHMVVANMNEDRQRNLNFEVLLLEKLDSSAFMCDRIASIIKENGMNDNDVCIVSSKIAILREIDYILRNGRGRETLTTFETKEMCDNLHKKCDSQKAFDNEIENIRRVKKFHFKLNSDTIKLSTIKSFKGLEISTLFLIIDSNNNEEIYTAITRTRNNLIVFTDDSSSYYNFFKE